MNLNTWILLSLGLLSCLVVGCGVESTQGSEAPELSEVEQLAAARKKGIVIYTELCSGCHGTDGTGGGSFPPLDGSEFVQGDPQRLALMVHKGVFGPIHVKGKRYHLEQMPGWEGSLSPGRTAALLSFLRTSWGNADVVSEKDALVTRDQATEWIAQAEEIEGPLHGTVYESDEWAELIEGEG